MIKHVLVAAGILALPGFANAATVTVTCNGSDVTAQLNADAAIVNETINLTGGTCTISSTVDITANGVTLSGPISSTGHPTAIIQMSSAAATQDIYDLIQVGAGPSLQATGVTLSNFILDGQKQDLYHNGSHGIFVRIDSSVTITNLDIMNITAACIDDAGPNTVIQGNTCENTNGEAVFVQGILLNGTVHPADNVLVEYNYAHNVALANCCLVGPAGKTWDGIDVDNWSGTVTVKGNILLNASDLIVHNTAGNPVIDNVTVVGNSVMNSSAAGIDLAAGGLLTNIVVLGNAFYDIHGLYCIVAGGTMDATIGNNFCLASPPIHISQASTVNAYGNLQY